MIAAVARLLASRSPRERLLLALLALGALPAAFLALVALPLNDARAGAQAELAAARASRDWYLARQLEIVALPVAGGADAPAAATPAPVGLGGIEARLIAAGLRQSVTLLANAPSRRVALSLGGVSFAALMDWLDALESEAGYRVAAMLLESAGPGRVDADLQLEPLR